MREVQSFIVIMYNNPFEYFETYREQINKALAGIREEPYKAAYGALVTAGLLGDSVFVCGNGGSASIAEHFSCDHSKGVHLDTNTLKPNVVSLSSNMAVITAIGNDLGFDKIFSKQLEFANAREKDVLVVVSSSGNSPNIISALERGNASGMVTIALVGFDGGAAAQLADYVLHVNSFNYGIVEDCHQVIMHSLAQALRIKEAVHDIKL